MVVSKWFTSQKMHVMSKLVHVMSKLVHCLCTACALLVHCLHTGGPVAGTSSAQAVHKQCTSSAQAVHKQCTSLDMTCIFWLVNHLDTIP